MENKVISPCISICKTDPVTGYCYGCARTNDEKIIWKNENTTNEWKSKNLEEIIKRMKGWQLETFKESYKHKLNNGISLYKKNLLEKTIESALFSKKINKIAVSTSSEKVINYLNKNWIIGRVLNYGNI